MAATLEQIVLGAFLLMAATFGAAQQTGVPARESAPAIKIGPGDLLEITVWDNADLSGRFRVDEKGEIVFPLVGPVRVAGDTAEQAGATLDQQLVRADILKPGIAQATVFIAEYATQGILVNGEVKSPGLYPALGIKTLNDMITVAGGVTPMASSKLIITRKSDPKNPIKVDYNPTALSPVIPQVQIFPGDTITVPRAGIIYVAGDVMHSGGYVLDGRSGLTVQEAMALAGGPNKAPALKDVHLVRKLEDGRKIDYVLNLRDIFKGKTPDVAMKDGDILFVPTSTGRLVTEQAIQSALGIGTQITIYKTAYQ